MWDGLKADMRTILDIRTMRYALVGVAALLFTITAVAAWLPQFYERQLGVKPGIGEGWVGLVAIAGVPGVLLGGRVADRWAPKMQGGRLALPAIFLFVGLSIFSVGYLVKPTIPAEVKAAQAAADAAGRRGRGRVSTTCAPAGATDAAIERADDAAEEAREDADDVGREAARLRLDDLPRGRCSARSIGFGIVAMSIPGLRAGLTDAVPAHLRGTGFGAFNLAAVVFGQAAAPFVVGGLSAAFDENLRTALSLVTPDLARRRARAVPGPQVPRRGHEQDHDGGPPGAAGRAGTAEQPPSGVTPRMGSGTTTSTGQRDRHDLRQAVAADPVEAPLRHDRPATPRSRAAGPPARCGRQADRHPRAGAQLDVLQALDRQLLPVGRAR